MRNIFISDNIWFLQGIKGLEKAISCKLHLLEAYSCCLDIDISSKNDLVILNISNNNLRHKILNYHKLNKCKCIILTSHENTKEVRVTENFPSIISDRIKIMDLLIILNRASNKRFSLRNTHPLEKEIFTKLNEGFPIKELAESLGVTSKYIYSLKIILLRNCGFQNIHPGAVLLYKDIMDWRAKNSERITKII